jgi:hypothetical protein
MYPMMSRILLLILVTTSFVAYAGASNNLVEVSLPKGVHIELPKNWVVLSENQRITLDSAVKSRLDLSNQGDEKSSLPFAANLYSDGGTTLAMVNVRYYPGLDLSQAEIEGSTSEEVAALDNELKRQMLISAKAANITVTSWLGTKLREINGISVFVTEYERKALVGAGQFRVRLVRVYSGSRSFTLTVSYKKSAAYLLEPITDRIISSLYADGIT